jgi:hypothetical protein
MNVQQLLADLPLVHGPEESRTGIYRLEDAMFDFLDRHLACAMKTLEVGAGSSTVIFAIKGTRHTCVVPDPKQPRRIQEYCAARGISLGDVAFILKKSQDALPAITEGDFDCILIDDSHGFPSPFVDWYYCAGLLKTGGIVIVDDLHIWTCSTLADFLHEAPEWRTVKETSRTAVFEKLRDGSQHQEWTQQPYVLRRSRGTAALPKVAYGLRLA